MSKASIALLVGWMLAIVLVALLATYFVLTAPVRRARRLLGEIAKVEIGTTTVEQFRRQLQAARLQTSSIACQGSDCTLSERAEVRTTSRLRLAPLTGIVTSVSFKDGIASEVYVWLEILDHNTARGMVPGTGVTVHESLESRSCPDHFCTYVSERDGYPWAVVEMDAAAPKEQRGRAFAINVGCMTKIGGCKRPATILPEVFGKPFP